jgi:hypothetical protein
MVLGRTIRAYYDRGIAMQDQAINKDTHCMIPDCLQFSRPIIGNHVHSFMSAEDQQKVIIGDPVLSASKSSYRIPIKYRFDLIPPVFLRQLAEVYEEGAQNYGEAKYIEKPLPYSVILNHLMNHLLKYCEGDRSELHMAKVAWAAATIINLDSIAQDKVLPAQCCQISDLSKYGAKALDAMALRISADEKTRQENDG